MDDPRADVDERARRTGGICERADDQDRDAIGAHRDQVAERGEAARLERCLIDGDRRRARRRARASASVATRHGVSMRHLVASGAQLALELVGASMSLRKFQLIRRHTPTITLERERERDDLRRPLSTRVADQASERGAARGDDRLERAEVGVARRGDRDRA